MQTTRKKMSLGKRLRRQGFDKSYYNRKTGYWRVVCSQCEAVVINSVPCHEHGCPNQIRER